MVWCLRSLTRTALIVPSSHAHDRHERRPQRKSARAVQPRRGTEDRLEGHVRAAASPREVRSCAPALLGPLCARGSLHRESRRVRRGARVGDERACLIAFAHDQSSERHSRFGAALPRPGAGPLQWSESGIEHDQCDWQDDVVPEIDAGIAGCEVVGNDHLSYVSDGITKHEDRERDDRREPETPAVRTGHDPEDTEGDVGEPYFPLEWARLPTDRLGDLRTGEEMTASGHDAVDADQEREGVDEDVTL